MSGTFQDTDPRERIDRDIIEERSEADDEVAQIYQEWLEFYGDDEADSP